MTVMDGNLYVGLGDVANGDAEVWKYASGSWSKIGGDNCCSSAWGNNHLGVYSMTNDGTYIYIGLGNATTSSQVWYGTGTASWTKIGGNGLNTSWTGHSTVRKLTFFGSQLYVW